MTAVAVLALVVAAYLLLIALGCCSGRADRAAAKWRKP